MAGGELSQHDGPLPVWVRAPMTGVEHFTGFSRTKLYDLATKGLIRSISIREPGQVKGTRLFHLKCILDYIERCERNAAAKVEAACEAEPA